MDGNPNKQGNGGQDIDDGVISLSKMPSYTEHMADIERDNPLGEKYYQLAREERERWIEEGRKKVTKAENLKPEDFNIVANPERAFSPLYGYEALEYRPIDENNENDMVAFNEHKEREIRDAEGLLQRYENVDMDSLAQCCKNQEIIDQIATKLEKDEEFTPEEKDFLGEAPDSDDAVIDSTKYMTPDNFYIMQDSLLVIPRYRELLASDDDEPSAWQTVARAQMREMARQNRVLLHANEEIRGALESMENRGENDAFAGETNVNRATGESRTFTLEDNYPRLNNESEGDYADRLKKIQLKTRLWEKKQ